MLAAGTLSQTSFSALAIGLPVLVPTLREEYDLSLGQIGVVLGAEWVGALVTMPIAYIGVGFLYRHINNQPVAA